MFFVWEKRYNEMETGRRSQDFLCWGVNNLRRGYLQTRAVIGSVQRPIIPLIAVSPSFNFFFLIILPSLPSSIFGIDPINIMNQWSIHNEWGFLQIPSNSYTYMFKKKLGKIFEKRLEWVINISFWKLFGWGQLMNQLSQFGKS